MGNGSKDVKIGKEMLSDDLIADIYDSSELNPKKIILATTN
jgi:hypothetical protein